MPESDQFSNNDLDRVERRTIADRRIPESDRRNADRIVAEKIPRRQNQDRRENTGK